MINTAGKSNLLPETPADVWAYVSPSRLNIWLRCPLAFRLRYIDGVRSPPSKSLFLGKVVHAGLEYYYRQKQRGVAASTVDVLEQMSAGWERWAADEQIHFTTRCEEGQLRNQAADLVAAYLAQLPTDEAAPTMVERRLEAPLVDPSTAEQFGISLLGIIDLVTDDAEGPVVCDFKTASRAGGPIDMMHEVQLTAYAYLFRQASHQREAGIEIRSLIKTRIPRIAYHRYASRTEAHLSRFFQIIRAYLDDLEQSCFACRPGFACSLCDFRNGECVDMSA